MANGTSSARVITVIETIGCKGNGTYQDPNRAIIQYWNFEGKLLAEKDTWKAENQGGQANEESI